MAAATHLHTEQCGYHREVHFLQHQNERVTVGTLLKTRVAADYQPTHLVTKDRVSAVFNPLDRWSKGYHNAYPCLHPCSKYSR
jgi:hypothetical protein